MSDYDEIIYCPKCQRRETFVVAGSGRKGICLKCGIEVLDLPAARCKTVHNCLFEMLGAVSNEVDK